MFASPADYVRESLQLSTFSSARPSYASAVPVSCAIWSPMTAGWLRPAPSARCTPVEEEAPSRAWCSPLGSEPTRRTRSECRRARDAKRDIPAPLSHRARRQPVVPRPSCGRRGAPHSGAPRRPQMTRRRVGCALHMACAGFGDLRPLRHYGHTPRRRLPGTTRLVLCTSVAGSVRASRGPCYPGSERLERHHLRDPARHRLSERHG
jgi:hypothetical protein